MIRRKIAAHATKLNLVELYRLADQMIKSQILHLVSAYLHFTTT